MLLGKRVKQQVNANQVGLAHVIFLAVAGYVIQ